MTKILRLKHFLSVERLSNQEIFTLIQRGIELKKGEHPIIPNSWFVSNLFFENSTRTHKSFEVAEERLNGTIIPFETSTSSVQKGESLYDTVLTLSALGIDICVIRHSEENYYYPLIESKTIQTSIINGGDGTGQHPSQCLLDLMTIYEEFHQFKDLTIAICGDLRHSRVARSNMMMLKRFGATLYFCGPKEWYDPQFDIYGSYADIDDVISKVDVCMLLRVQHERHTEEEEASFSKEDYHRQFGLTKERYQKLQPHAIVMHPAPVNRDAEIADELVEAPKSRIVEAMKNGVYVRMAILEAILAARDKEGEKVC